MPCKGCGTNCQCTSEKCGTGCKCDAQCKCPCKNQEQGKEGCC
ncbi:Metallothionein-2, partial [Pseudolycoriella hygida]